jgi:hypothetical protein
MSFNLSCTAQDLNAAVTKANAAAPQSTTYTKTEVDTALAGKANASDLGAAAAKGFDASPTSGNTDNAVSSAGVYQALSGKAKLQFFKASGNRVLRLTFVSGNDRGNLLLSVGVQNESKVPAIILINVRADGFLTATNITPNADSIVSSVSVSSDKSYIDVTLTVDSTWTQPTILSLMSDPPEVAVTWL